MNYRVMTKDGKLQVKDGSSHPAESGLLGLKEISNMNAAKAKRKENSSLNRRNRESRKPVSI